MTATNQHFKYNTSTVVGGRSFDDKTENPFIPVPHRIILDARFSLQARLFSIWCYGKSNNYVFVKKNLCFELGITDQQRRTIFAELKKMGVMSDHRTKNNNLHFWALSFNFTIFNGIGNLEERRQVELPPKKQNQQIAPASACDLLISTDHGSCVNQQITGAVEINQLNEHGVKKEKQQQQAPIVVPNSVTNEDLEREIDEVMLAVGEGVKNRAAYRRGIKRNKLKAIAEASAAAIAGVANAKTHANTSYIGEQHLDCFGEVHSPNGLLCMVKSGDLGQFRSPTGGIFLVKDSARIWQKIDSGELDLRPFTHA